MLKVVNTLYTIEEMETDGHAPVLFHCSDGNNYFCKYIIWTRPKEINYLAFEVVASVLLKELNIPTPDIALVKIEKGTLNKDKIKKNLRLKEGMIVFGSKEISPVTLVEDFSNIQSKTDFKKILNPADIIRIALFDLWVKNADRGRGVNSGYNFNLLFSVKNGRRKIVAMDHAFIFKDGRNIGDFYPNTMLYGNHYLFQTPFYQSIIKYYEKGEYYGIVDKFISLLSKDYSKIIKNTIAELPSSWNLIEDMDSQMIRLLSNSSRIEKLADTLKNAKQ